MIIEGSSVIYSWAEIEIEALVERAYGWRSTEGLHDPIRYQTVRNIIEMCKREPTEFNQLFEAQP